MADVATWPPALLTKREVEATEKQASAMEKASTASTDTVKRCSVTGR
jgi:hypothetical protein